MTSAVMEGLLIEAARAHPRECCGILLGSAEAIIRHLPAANVHPSPETHFEIDPQALINAHRESRQNGPQIAGYYHSHPNGRAEPSETDRAMAASDGTVWAIAADGEVTFWRTGKHGFSRVHYRIVEG